MNIQDRRGSFTAEELRQKYNLDGLTKDRKAIQQAENQITKINNEQNQIIEAIILSLADIEIQSEIMLWFFNATPTLENVPALTWEDNETKDEHIGDLYFDRETGYVYQFQLNDEVYEWVNQTNSSLIQAMAISNAAIDTNDNNRRVFLNSPITPYNNGDWYILSNGDLKICQISKDSTETYEEKDFIIASKYIIGTQAQEMNNKIVVTAGQVTTIETGIDEINEKIEDNRYYTDKTGEKHLISEQTYELSKTVNGMKQTIKYSGGYNLFDNIHKQFGQEGWEGSFNNLINDDTIKHCISESVLRFQNDTETREKIVPNGTYNFSCVYKKLIELAECYIKINGHQIDLTEMNWTNAEYTFEVNSNLIHIDFFGDTANSALMGDILFIPGDIKQIWTPNPNEVYTDEYELGGGKFKLKSSDKNVYFEASADGIRTKNKITEETTSEFTEDGMYNKKSRSDEAEIARISIRDIGTQTILNRF